MSTLEEEYFQIATLGSADVLVATLKSRVFK